MWYYLFVRFTRWTLEAIQEAAKSSPNVRYFHHNYRGAEKAAKRMGILHTLFPDKQAHAAPYTKDQLVIAATYHKNRAAFQAAVPAMYNAAKRLGILNELFPIQHNRKYTDKELIQKAQTYPTIKDWAEKDNGSYQVASRRGILAEYGPSPVQGISAAEQDLLKYLQTLAPDFKTKRFGNEYELDCYSEAHKIGIEYNGFYWHSEEAGKSRSYHLKKTKYFEKRGIRVIHIWEDEWRDRRKQVESYLRSALGANMVKIGARKCEFKEIEPKAAKVFLEATHIQGGKLTSIIMAVGCFYQGELVGVCTFGKHHRGNDAIVLNRFACLPSLTVSGFLAKASKIAAARFGTIYSWANYAKSQANGYLAAGWTIIKTHPPDYFYSDRKGQVVSKQSRRKSVINTPTSMTESQHAKLDGLYRIWDCGKILLIFKAA